MNGRFPGGMPSGGVMPQGYTLQNGQLPVPQGVVNRPLSGPVSNPVNYGISGNDGFGQMQQVQAYTNPNGQTAIGYFGNNTGTTAGANNPGAWNPETNPQILQNWAQSLGVPVSSFVNPTNAAGGNPDNGWTSSTPLQSQTAAQGAAQGMLGTGGINPGVAAQGSALAPAISGASGTTSNSGGDINGTMASTPGTPSYWNSPSYGSKGGKGSSGMPSGSGGYTSSSSGAPNYGSGFLNPNTLPMGYGNNVSGWSSPSMTGDVFSWYGGQAPIPQGGMYNQMAQMMGGPSYAPAGSNWYSMPPGQTANFGPYGSSGGKGASPSYGGKGGGYLQPPSPYQGISSYGVQNLGNQSAYTSPQTASYGGGASPLTGSQSLESIMGPYGYNPLALQMAGL